MLKKIIIVICVLLSVVACNRLKGPKTPENLISKEKMVNILIDARIIASATATNRKTMQDHGISMGNYVFDKYNIDSLQFALSNEYYAFYVDDYEEIYIKVEDSFKKLQTKFKKLEEEEEKQRLKKIKEDSLKVFKGKDALIDISTRKVIEEEGILISPISETGVQSQ